MKKDYGRNIFNGEVQTGSGYIRRQKWTHPAVGTATAIHAAISTVGTFTTGITQPDFPRVLSVTLGGATHTATSIITINGIDIRGNTISDAITLPGSTTTTNGVKAFKTVTSIVTTTGIDASNTVSVGTAAPLGLDRIMNADEYINGSVDGVVEATRATITTSATDISLNTVSFNTTLANTKTFRAVYVTKEKTTDTNSTS